jgi:hypothetical protein
MTYNKGHGPINKEGKISSLRCDKCLEYSANYVEEQCDDSTPKYERLVRALEKENPKFVHRKFIS